MPQVGFKVVGGVDAMGDTSSGASSFSLTHPAGWVMIWWWVSVALIALVFLSL